MFCFECKVSQLIASVGDINVQDGDGQTALHRVCLNGLADLASQLLEEGANMDVQDKTGRTALMVAQDPRIYGMLLLRQGVQGYWGFGGLGKSIKQTPGHEACVSVLQRAQESRQNPEAGAKPARVRWMHFVEAGLKSAEAMPELEYWLGEAKGLDGIDEDVENAIGKLKGLKRQQVKAALDAAETESELEGALAQAKGLDGIDEELKAATDKLQAMVLKAQETQDAMASVLKVAKHGEQHWTTGGRKQPKGPRKKVVHLTHMLGLIVL